MWGNARRNGAPVVPTPDDRGCTRPRQRLGRRQRLTQTKHFEETYAQGRKWVGRYMVLWLREGEGAALRLGVVASRKVGGAVKRNRARRRLREVYRRHRERLDGRYDVVLVARARLPEAAWPDVVEDFLKLAARAGLTNDKSVSSE